jgi:hypothetical protein
VIRVRVVLTTIINNPLQKFPNSLKWALTVASEGHHDTTHRSLSNLIHCLPQPHWPPWLFFFLGSPGDWTQHLVFARLALYHLSHKPSHFCQGWPQTLILLLHLWVLVSQVYATSLIFLSHIHTLNCRAFVLAFSSAWLTLSRHLDLCSNVTSNERPLHFYNKIVK